MESDELGDVQRQLLSKYALLTDLLKHTTRNFCGLCAVGYCKCAVYQ